MRIINSLLTILLLSTVLNAKSFDLSKTECSKYLLLSSNELTKEIKKAFKSQKGTIIPFCMQLKKEISIFTKSKDIHRVNSLHKIEVTLHELEDFGIDMKSMNKDISIEYKKLNYDLRKKGFISKKDKETIFVLLTQKDKEIVLEKLKRKNNDLYTKKIIFEKEEFIDIYPRLAFSRGIKVEPKDIKIKLMYEISVDYPQVRSAATSSDKVLIKDIKFKEGDIVNGFTRSQDNKQVSTNNYHNIYFKDVKGNVKEFWLNKDFLKEIR